MLWIVIMAGGSGTRFWPESREKTPKQFLHFFSSRSLLEETLNRVKKIVPPSRILLITQQDKVRQLRRFARGIPASQIIGEPVGRNTAPCAAIAASLVFKKDPDGVIALMPSDHLIRKEKQFKQSCLAAYKAAQTSLLPVTFGIKPSSAHTGYGYLERGKLYQKSSKTFVYKLKSFREKPSLLKAKKYYRSRKFYWNSGMFVWKAQAFLKEIQRSLPKVARLSQIITQGPLTKKMKQHFKKMPVVSIDYGLMEKMKGRILMIAADFGWDDVGSWSSLDSVMPKDRSQNIVFGKPLLIDSTRNIVRTQKRLVVLLGVQDLVVVDTDDALMICAKDKAQSVRKVIRELKRVKLKKYL